MKTRLFACCGAALLLSGCGGGGDSSLQALELNTRGDALRELGVLESVVGFGYGSDSSSGKRAGKAASRPLAKATQAEDCDDGTASSTDGIDTRAFELFPVQRTVSFERSSARDCARYFDDGTIITIDGDFETGLSDIDSDGRQYGYTLYGANGRPSVTTIEPSDSEDPDSYVIAQALGVSEFVDDNGRYESRTILRFTGSGYSSDYGNNSGEFTIGRSGEPMISTTRNDTETLDGPYSYRSDRCGGGALRVETLSPLSFDNNGFTGGRLRVRSGDDSLIYTFNLDGSATLEFSDGSAGTLSSAEVEDVYYEGSDCYDN